MDTYFKSDVEFIAHLYNKEDPTDDELEAASRIEALLQYLASFTEGIHKNASAAMKVAPCRETAHIVEMTCPMVDRVPRIMN